VATLRPTLEDLRRGLSLPTGAQHKIVVPQLIVRVRLIGILFETDKTFVLPSAMPGLRKLKSIYDGHAGKTVLVSGHTDTAGTTQHNLALSVERAASVAAFLQDDDGDWLPRYDAGAQVSARWGIREDQHMLSLVADGGGLPYLAGPVTGRSDAATRDAVKRFRADIGLGDGAMDKGARQTLIQKYMATDGTTLPAGTTVATHGCGETHPSVQTADSVALADNRRVELFFFRGPVKPPPQDPCPSGGCPEYPQWLEETFRTIDVNSVPEVVVFIVDELGLPLRKTQLKLIMPDGTTESVSTDDNGKIFPRVAPGVSFDIVIDDVHEAGPGDSLQTPSGHHFAAGGDEPAADDGPEVPE
jgi:outer membrane protein OmpA-like peptidoglycan-associated protein